MIVLLEVCALTREQCGCHGCVTGLAGVENDSSLVVECQDIHPVQCHTKMK